MKISHTPKRTSLKIPFFVLTAALICVAGILLLRFGDLAKQFRRTEAYRPSVILVAMEGGASEIISFLRNQSPPGMGEMYREGARGVVEPDEPFSPAAYWTTVATGSSPDLHGIVGSFSSSRPRQLSGSGDWDRVPVWRILSDASVSVGVVGWEATWPALTVNGFLITDRLFYTDFGFPLHQGDPMEGCLFPPMSREEVQQYRPRGGDCQGTYSRTLCEARFNRNVALDLFRKLRPRFMAVSLPGPDALRIKGADQEERESYIGLLNEAIRDLRIMARPKALTLVIASGRPGEDGERPSDAAGFFMMAGDGAAPDVDIGRITTRDIVPTILYALGAQVPRHLDGTVLLRAFSAEFVESHPIRFADSTYPATTTSTTEPHPGVEGMMVSCLKELGYVR